MACIIYGVRDENKKQVNLLESGTVRSGAKAYGA